MKTMSFASAGDFRAWLSKNHRQADGILLRIYKKDSGAGTVTYAEALDQALCFGWIDGQKRPYDQQSWLQHFTPRRRNSGWSKTNTKHAERLIATGEMAPAGLREVNAAKADGRWQAAYDSFGKATVPDDFLSESRGTKKPKPSSQHSTKPTFIRSFTGCKRRRSRRPERSECRRSSRSWPGARSSTKG